MSLPAGLGIGLILDGFSKLAGKAIDKTGDLAGNVLNAGLNQGANALQGIVGKFGDRAVDYALGGQSGLMQGGISNVMGMLEKRMDLDIGAKDFGVLGQVKYWDSIYGTLKNTNQALGITGNLGKTIQSNFHDALPAVANLGGGIEDLASEYQSFIEYSSRNRIFSEEQIGAITEIKLALGSSMSNIFAEFTRSGVMIEQTKKDLDNMVISSNEIGVNFKASSKTFAENLSKVNSYNFSQGRLGLMKMAEYAEATNISINSALGLTDTLLEGGIQKSIEMSAQLQTLGGEFAQFGDPFQLYSKALTDPEGLQENIARSISNTMVLNKELGQLEFAGSGAMLRLREASKITGLSFDELATAAKNIRKEEEIENLFSFSMKSQNDFDNILTKVAGIAEYSKEAGTWVVQFGEEVKSVSQIQQKDLKDLDSLSVKEPEDVFKDLIKSNETLSEGIERVINIFKLNFISDMMYKVSYEALKPILDNTAQQFEQGNGALAEFGGVFKELSEGTAETFQSRLDMLGENEGFFKDTLTTISNSLETAVDYLKATLDFFGINVGYVASESQDEVIDSARSYLNTSGAANFFGSGLGLTESVNDAIDGKMQELWDSGQLEYEPGMTGGYGMDYDQMAMENNLVSIFGDDGFKTPLGRFETAGERHMKDINKMIVEVADLVDAGMTLEQAERQIEMTLRNSRFGNISDNKKAMFESEFYFERLKPFLPQYSENRLPITLEGSEEYKQQRDFLKQRFQVDGKLQLDLGDYSKMLSQDATKKLLYKLVEKIEKGENNSGGFMSSAISWLF